MKNLYKRLVCLMLALMMVGTLGVTCFAAEEPTSVTILFTHDLHSHLLPSDAEDGGEYGGYARLMTVIR